MNSFFDKDADAENFIYANSKGNFIAYSEESKCFYTSHPFSFNNGECLVSFVCKVAYSLYNEFNGPDSGLFSMFIAEANDESQEKLKLSYLEVVLRFADCFFSLEKLGKSKVKVKGFLPDADPPRGKNQIFQIENIIH